MTVRRTADNAPCVVTPNRSGDGGKLVVRSFRSADRPPAKAG